MEKYLAEQQKQENDRALEALAAEHHEDDGKVPDRAAIRAHITNKILERLTKAYHHLDEKRRESNKKPTQHSDQAMLAQARALERYLYNTTPTWQAYQNEDTLNSRLKEIQQTIRRFSRSPDWQRTGADLSLRRQMIRRIHVLLRKRRSPDMMVHNKKYWQERLPKMAQQVEAVLYRRAHTREEYADTENLVLRLTVLAMEHNGPPEEDFHHNVCSV